MSSYFIILYKGHEKLSRDIADSFSNSLHAELDNVDFNELVSKYNTTLEQIYDDHALVQTKRVKHRPYAISFNEELRAEKREKRRLERKYRKSGLTIDNQLYRDQCERYNSPLERQKSNYYRKIIENTDRNQLCSTTYRMFKVKNITLPTYESLHQLVEDFNNFFINNINDIRAGLPTLTTSTDTTEERQLSCSFHEFRTTLDTSVNDIVMSLSSKPVST